MQRMTSLLAGATALLSFPGAGLNFVASTKTFSLSLLGIVLAYTPARGLERCTFRARSLLISDKRCMAFWRCLFIAAELRPLRFHL
ncbi:uncharacterized protein EI90DRAFT_1332410 [Cantharellus anzutake]|uniref:uncharacterized protein n=1 Tax=Cantharellus anzutake TaxID=1750568 RepID=UPI0019032975|nr:uncharacterized protein EI90DRAFT_1332410 [Cantharellus anzutake]KAF8342340.1 hypothetical protein EI90DRAFT_1332410 [Cantharellus anzutake]